PDPPTEQEPHLPPTGEWLATQRGGMTLSFIDRERGEQGKPCVRAQWCKRHGHGRPRHAAPAYKTPSPSTPKAARASTHRARVMATIRPMLPVVRQMLARIEATMRAVGLKGCRSTTMGEEKVLFRRLCSW